MQQIITVTELREHLDLHRRQDVPLILVPTMGNLHAGHMTLVEKAREMEGCVIATIFVNPTQFVEGEDFADYPRTIENDLEKLSAAGVDITFIPELQEIYPENVQYHTKVVVPDLEAIYCGKFRPGHFTGVATIVCKLFNIVLPDHAVFGEKDYQQLVVIKRLVRDLEFPVNIIGVPTIRESDGLAMSSRNQYLNIQERKNASILYKTLTNMAALIGQGNHDYEQLERDGIRNLTDHGFKPEYINVCDAEDLGRPSTDKLVILAAAWLGRARLIDNVAVQN